MDNESLTFLEALLTSHSPSGFETAAQDLWLERTRAFADQGYKDVHGNAIAVVNPACEFKIMLAGHMDEIGLMVMNIADEGVLEVAAIGGFDPRVAPGTPVQVLTRAGLVDGVIGKPARYGDEEDEKKKPKISDLWVDIGAADKEEAAKHVQAGDPISVTPTYRRLLGDRVVSKGHDDRIGAFVCSETLRLLKGRDVGVGVWSVATVQEEVGSRGAVSSAYNIDAQVGIAIDVAHTSDYPTTQKKRIGDLKVGAGPILNRGANINPVLGARMEALAAQASIPVQIGPVPTVTWTDANPMQMLRGGRATALVRIPLRYMHSPVEIASLGDVENASKLLAELICSLQPTDSFIP